MDTTSLHTIVGHVFDFIEAEEIIPIYRVENGDPLIGTQEKINIEYKIFDKGKFVYPTGRIFLTSPKRSSSDKMYAKLMSNKLKVDLTKMSIIVSPILDNFDFKILADEKVIINGESITISEGIETIEEFCTEVQDINFGAFPSNGRVVFWSSKNCITSEPYQPITLGGTVPSILGIDKKEATAIPPLFFWHGEEYNMLDISFEGGYKNIIARARLTKVGDR